MKPENEHSEFPTEIEILPKTVLSLRCSPEFKNLLTQEALKLGIPISEHAENLLLNRKQILLSNTDLQNEKADLQQQIKILTSEKTLSEESLRAMNLKLKSEIANLTSQLSAKSKETEIFYDEKLLALFAALKGKEDRIETPDGFFNIIYETPTDVLLGLLYSFKTKKS